MKEGKYILNLCPNVFILMENLIYSANRTIQLYMQFIFLGLSNVKELPEPCLENFRFIYM